MIQLGIVTVTHNSSHILDGFLKRLIGGSDPDIRIIVVDSGSADVDETRLIAEKYGAVFVSSLLNLGYGTCSNRGAALADTEWLAFVNPDVNLHVSTLESLIEQARDHDIQCIGPQVFDEHGVLRDSWGQMTAPPWRKGNATKTREPGLTVTQSISGCCMVMPRNWFERLGGFDESFFMFCEELDLHKRMGELGGRVATSTQVHVTTSGGASSAGVTVRWSQVERCVAHIHFTRKHYSRIESFMDAALRFIEIGLNGPRYRPRVASWLQLWSGIMRSRKLINRALHTWAA